MTDRLTDRQQEVGRGSNLTKRGIRLAQESGSIRSQDVETRLEEDGKPFRLNNQRLMLTYARTDVEDKDTMIEFIRRQTKRDKATVFVARESHKDGSKHLHVAIDLGKPWQSRNVKVFDFKGRHPNICAVQSIRHWANVLAYLQKEDQETGIAKNVVQVAAVWNSDNQADAMLKGVDPIRAKILWEVRPAEETKKVELPELGWKPLVDSFIEEANVRKVGWCCSYVGNVGKSILCRYLCQENPEDVAKMRVLGRVTDMTYALAQKVKNGWNGKVLLLDLPRRCAERDTVYEFMEMIKDGWGMSSKYDCPEFELPNDPVIIVFANFWPVFKWMSRDRWHLMFINGQSDVGRIVNVREAAQLVDSEDSEDSD